MCSPESKVCSVCGILKKISEFSKTQSRCKPCAAIYFREWAAANVAHLAEKQRRYRETHREELRDNDRGRYQRDPHVGARRLIQQRVAKGRMPAASTLPCTDCDNTAQDYDHYLGYEGDARAQVQPVCRPCHRLREKSRKAVAQ